VKQKKNTTSPKKKSGDKKPIEQYEHKNKKRANIPPVGLVTPETDPIPPAQNARKTYQYDPHLDPQLTWAGKAERTSFDIPTVSLHVHERIDPRTIMEAVKAKNGNEHEPQMSLFGRPEENRPLREEFPFYDHKKPLGWKNRLIAGDSLLVMNSLLEKEGLGGQVQMIYIDLILPKITWRVSVPHLRVDSRGKGIVYGRSIVPFIFRLFSLFCPAGWCAGGGGGKGSGSAGWEYRPGCPGAFHPAVPGGRRGGMH